MAGDVVSGSCTLRISHPPAVMTPRLASSFFLSFAVTFYLSPSSSTAL
eukprot:CAMPEP_0174709256 /NCGR_PEP_ID=MMETSP1094-20130205/11277_1 /TAXON_ID=156173 /ORGANISM="Chrysochromulina brevifilum, Strain UTEX LB 985" /LENGTH=47 /DNA_ID= /DNA_START= /DNA_END= /DNA_ORIENTATION=